MLRATLFTLLVIASGSIFAATYHCHGVIYTKGESVLTIEDNSLVSVSAKWQWEGDHQQTQYHANCSSFINRHQHSYTYYDTTRSSDCPLDYVRLHDNFNEKGEGLIALVSRTGGDRHDDSGYTYAYFYCNR